jgi:hypothetical protein
LNFGVPLGSAATVRAPPELAAGAADEEADAAAAVVVDAAALVEVLLLLLEPQAARVTATATALSVAEHNLTTEYSLS